MIEGALETMVEEFLKEIDKDIHNNLVEQEKVNPGAMGALYE
jgi:hypothetical protein